MTKITKKQIFRAWILFFINHLTSQRKLKDNLKTSRWSKNEHNMRALPLSPNFYHSTRMNERQIYLCIHSFVYTITTFHLFIRFLFHLSLSFGSDAVGRSLIHT